MEGTDWSMWAVEYRAGRVDPVERYLEDDVAPEESVAFRRLLERMDAHDDSTWIIVPLGEPTKSKQRIRREWQGRFETNPLGIPLIVTRHTEAPGMLVVNHGVVEAPAEIADFVVVDDTDEMEVTDSWDLVARSALILHEDETCVVTIYAASPAAAALLAPMARLLEEEGQQHREQDGFVYEVVTLVKNMGDRLEVAISHYNGERDWREEIEPGAFECDDLGRVTSYIPAGQRDAVLV